MMDRQAMEDLWAGLELLGPIPVLALVLLYFVPAGVAAYRRHPQAPAIFFLNLLLGWTTLGWVGAMVWASLNVARRQGEARRGGSTLRTPRDPDRPGDVYEIE